MAVTAQLSESLEALFEGRTSTIVRDLKLSLHKVLSEGALTEPEAAPVLLALATSVGHDRLASLAYEWMRELGDTPEVADEAREGAAMMAMLNTYYSFRQKLDDASYGPAGLRMTAIARPAMGKLRWEMLAFACSVLNGCQPCLTLHERVLREAGATTDKIHDLARLAAIVKGIGTLA